MDKRLIILVLLFLGTVSLAFSQHVGSHGSEYQSAYNIGLNDAKKDVSSPLWMGIGFATGGGSAIYPLFASPNIPQGKLIGQSEDFVAGYSDGYTEGHKKAIQKNSCIGGGVSWACCAAYYVGYYILWAQVY